MWEKIKAVMDRKGMTMYAVSKKAGIDQNVLINLKVGRTKRIYFDNMQKIADALDASLDEFR